MFVQWIIWCAPLCILSLVAVAIGAQSDLGEVLETLGWLFASFTVGVLCQFFIVYCGLYYLFIRSNPFNYFKHLVEAFILAFSCASSAATLPVTLEVRNEAHNFDDAIFQMLTFCFFARNSV